jgi:rhodanese-related sulfurtransferase
MSTQRLTTTRSITAKQLDEILRGGKSVDVIDVRTPAEFRSAHVAIARSVPLETLDPAAVVSAREFRDEPLYVMCRSGNRSEKACATFATAGYGDVVVNVEGGVAAWAQAGLPLVRGRYMLPLDRQVRTATGILVLLGAVLGYLVSPWFYALSGYCGAGLIFAGITDICPLSWTIAKMPWNQGPVAPPCSH